MTKIAFLGLGIMGSRMAANLARAGHELTVWNRTAATAEAFAAAHSVTAASTPAAAAADAGMGFTMVVDGPQGRDVLLGRDGAAHGGTPGALFVDCSTIGPAWTLELGEALEQRGFSLLDAQGTGSPPQDQAGRLHLL